VKEAPSPSGPALAARSQSHPVPLDRVGGLDALRGFAAVSVVFYHCHALLSLQMWPAWTGYLSMAVPLFFALSAFSMCLRYNGRLGVSDTVSNFYLRRYLRIAPLFYFMLLIYMTRRLANGWSLPPIEDILLNLTFLFPFDPNKNESLVAAGWSLGIEMIFYSLFPLIIAFVTNLSRAIAFFCLSILMQGAAGYFLFRLLPDSNFYWLSFPTQFAFFAGGIVAFNIYVGLRDHDPIKRLFLAVILLTSSVIALVYGTKLGVFEARFGGWPGLRPLIGFLLTAVALALALRPFAVLVNRFSVFLGEISYGIYLIHPFVILVLGQPLFSAFETAGMARPEAAALTIAAVILATIAAATASFRWLEQPMMKLQRLAPAKPKRLRS
jgi:peptidoglycan/LPS O-acetylase OafA/YrhL